MKGIVLNFDRKITFSKNFFHCKTFERNKYRQDSHIYYSYEHGSDLLKRYVKSRGPQVLLNLKCTIHFDFSMKSLKNSVCFFNMPNSS